MRLLGMITYYAGRNPGYTNAIQISATIPTAWTLVTRDVENAARQMLGFFNDNVSSTGPSAVRGPTPDNTQEPAYALAGAME